MRPKGDIQHAKLPGRRSLSDYLAPVAIIAAALVAYHNSYRGAFLYDDVHAIQMNPYIRSVRTCFSAPPQASLAGRPIASLTFALNYQIFDRDAPPLNPAGAPPDLDTRGFHVVNLGIHILAALALYGVIRRTLASPRLNRQFGDQAALLAGATALLWVIHPLTTQSVTYIIQRTESLAGLFYLLTLYCAIRVFEKNRFSIWIIAAIMACALGMGTKEVVATAPLAVILYDLIFYPGIPRQRFARWSLYMGLAATWSILLALMVHGPRSLSVGFQVPGVTWWRYALTEGGVILHYIRLALWPAHLCLDYAWNLDGDRVGQLLQCGVVIALLLLTGYGVIRRRPEAYPVAWFFLILAPTSSFVPIKDPAFEQRMYLPLAAIVLTGVIGVFLLLSQVRVLPRHAIAGLLFVVVVAGLTSRTVARNADYRDATTMWKNVLEQRPNNARALSALGTEYLNSNQIAEAISLYERSVAVDDSDWKRWENLGRAYYKNKEHERALECYHRALRINGQIFSSYYDMGVIYSDMGRLAESQDSYQRALDCPGGDDYRAHFNLGNTLMRLNRPADAIVHYKRAQELNPGMAKAVKALEEAQRLASGR